MQLAEKRRVVAGKKCERRAWRLERSGEEHGMGIRTGSSERTADGEVLPRLCLALLSKVAREYLEVIFDAALRQWRSRLLKKDFSSANWIFCAGPGSKASQKDGSSLLDRRETGEHKPLAGRRTQEQRDQPNGGRFGNFSACSSRLTDCWSSQWNTPDEGR